MTIWATADGVPFFAGTYFPPRGASRRGPPGFLPTLQRIAGALGAADAARSALAAAQLAGESARLALAPQPAVGVPGAAEIR